MTIVAAAYFAYLAAVAIARLKLRPAMLSVAAIIAIFTIGMPHVMPLVYLLIGYWLPALIVASRTCGSSSVCSTSIGDCSGRTDSRGSNAARHGQSSNISNWRTAVLRGRACRIRVPSARRDGAEHRSILVDGAARRFMCYGLLPWLPTRAPRAIEPRRDGDAFVDQAIEHGRAGSRKRAVEYVSERPHRGIGRDSARCGA